MAKVRQNFRIDLPAEDHLRQVECVIVGHSPAFDNRLFDAELFGELGQLLSAAVNDTDPNPNLVQKSKLFSERRKILFVFRDLARKLDDKRLALEIAGCRETLRAEDRVFRYSFY